MKKKRLSERQRLIALVDSFAAEMKSKLLSKEREGWKGWSDGAFKGDFQCELVSHAMRAFAENDARQLIDVANFAAFVWHMAGRPKS